MKRTKGQGLIEFALIIPIIILLFTVFIDLARAVFFYASLSNAVREGTRYAIVNPLPLNSAQVDIIRNTVRVHTSGIDPSAVTVTVTVTTTTPPDGNARVTVVATFTFQPITPGLKLLLGSSSGILLRAQSSALVAPLYQP